MVLFLKQKLISHLFIQTERGIKALRRQSREARTPLTLEATFTSLISCHITDISSDHFFSSSFMTLCAVWAAIRARCTDVTFTSQEGPAKNSSKQWTYTCYTPSLLTSWALGLNALFISREMMSLGTKRHWTFALNVLTGNKQIKVEPLVEYFKPLTSWLIRENSK